MYAASNCIEIFPISNRNDNYRLLNEHNLTKIVRAALGATCSYVLHPKYNVDVQTCDIEFVINGYYVFAKELSIPDDENNLYAYIALDNNTHNITGTDEEDGYYKGVSFTYTTLNDENYHELHLLTKDAYGNWSVPETSTFQSWVTVCIDGGTL